MKNTIEVARHLPDKDDLRLQRNGHLDLEHAQESSQIAEKIVSETRSEGKKIIAFIVSPKNRTIESADLVVEEIKKNAPEIRIIINLDENIREIDQGLFNLTEDYKFGDQVPELKDANDIFWEETSNQSNYSYHFGDPELQPDGTYKHPSFSKFFAEYGESYAEMSLRLYRALLDLYENRDALSSVKFVVMTHGAPLAIYKELEEIASHMMIEGVNPEVGTIMDLTWEYFKKRKKDVSEKNSHVESISVDPLLNEQVVERLKQEIAYMEKNYKLS